MKRTLTIILTAGLLAACSPEYEEAATTAPREPARVDQPAPAPRPEPEPEPDIPFTYGDDPYFDRLWDKCDDGDLDACDDLFWESPMDSRYEEFGLERGAELMAQTEVTDRDVVDTLGAEFLLDLVWDDITRTEQNDLCNGLAIFGPDVAGALIAEGAEGLVTPSEAGSWLVEKCR